MASDSRDEEEIICDEAGVEKEKLKARFPAAVEIMNADSNLEEIVCSDSPAGAAATLRKKLSIISGVPRNPAPRSTMVAPRATQRILDREIHRDSLVKHAAQALAQSGEAIDIPESLPYHFRLDVACVWLGAKKGKYRRAQPVAKSVFPILQREWRRARRMQERAWLSTGKLPPEVEKCYRIQKRRGASLIDVVIPEDVAAGEASESSEEVANPSALLTQWKEQPATFLERQEFKHVMRVKKLGCPTSDGDFRDIRAEDLTNAPSCLHLQMVVDLEGDPLLKDLGYNGPTIFKVPVYLYEKYLAPSASDLEAPTRELRIAKIPDFDYAMVLPVLPYPSCELKPPPLSNSIRETFPDDRLDTLTTDPLEDVLMAARAKLAWLFWDCFDYIFPDSEEPSRFASQAYTFNGEMGIVYDDNGIIQRVIPNGQAHVKGIKEGKKILRIGDMSFDDITPRYLAEAENRGSDYEVTVGSVTVTKTKLGLRKTLRLRDCMHRRDALDVLWRLTPPKPFQIPFRHCVSGDDWSKERGLLGAVSYALQQVARKVDEHYRDLAPGLWYQVDKESEDWPLIARLPRDRATESSDEACLIRPKSLAAMAHGVTKEASFKNMTSAMRSMDCDAELAIFQYLAVMGAREECAAPDEDDEDAADGDGPVRGPSDDVITSGPSCCSIGDDEEKVVEDKLVNVCVDLRRWESDREVDVMDINANDVWEVDEMLGVVMQLEECAALLEEKDLQQRISQLAYGLHAVQRGLIKQELRNVGLTVFEAERFTVNSDEVFEAIVDPEKFLQDGFKKMRKEEEDIEELRQRVLFISAPDAVLKQAAESRNWICTVSPNIKTGVYPGGFAPDQFTRDGPTQKFWMSSKTDPYPYPAYFRPSDASADPMTLFSRSERKHLVRLFVTDPISEKRHPDGSIDARQGGANMDPGELISASVLEDFVPLNDGAMAEHLMNHWVFPWREYGIYRAPQQFMANESNNVKLHFGPQIASFFEFTSFYKWGLLSLLPIAAFAEYAGTPGEDSHLYGKGSLWYFVRPTVGLLIAVWGALFCALWRRRVHSLTFRWCNGQLEPGTELQQVGKDVARVRAEFAIQFRYRFETGDLGEQEARLEQLREVLRYHKLNPDVSEEVRKVIRDSFNDRSLRQDIKKFNEVCYVSPWRRLLRAILVALVSLFLNGIAVLATYVSMYVADKVKEDGEFLFVKIESFRTARYVGFLISGFASGVFIPLLNYMNRIVSIETTRWQNHRTQADHERSLFSKLFTFQFFNRFNSLFWIAFWRQDMQQLYIQVLSLLAMPILSVPITDVLMPYYYCVKEAKRQVESGEMVALPADYGHVNYVHAGELHGGDIGRSLSQMSRQLLSQQNQSFDVVPELIERVVQFGQVALFMTACPLAPLVALLTTFLTERADALKLCWLQRMPEPRMTVGIGMSFKALQVICFLALAMNCLLLVLSKYPCKDSDLPNNDDVMRHINQAIWGTDATGGKAAGLDLMFPNIMGTQKLIIILLVENAMLILMVVAFKLDPVSISDVEEQYRQQYFENRERRSYEEDEDDQGQVSAMRRRQQAGAGRATEMLPPGPPVRSTDIGGALDFRAAARATMTAAVVDRMSRVKIMEPIESMA